MTRRREYRDNARAFVFSYANDVQEVRVRRRYELNKPGATQPWYELEVLETGEILEKPWDALWPTHRGAVGAMNRFFLGPAT